jgi:hypothetical protein
MNLMKNLSHVTALLTVIISLLFQSCYLLSDEETDKRCKENQINTEWSCHIAVMWQIPRDLDQPTADNNILDARDLEFHGAVRKMDCRGNESDFKEINCTLHPSLIVASNATYYNFRLAPPDFYDFSFSNNLEWVSVEFTMKAIFDDGSVYQSSQAYDNSERVEYWEDGMAYTFNMNNYLSWQLVTE